MKNKRINIGDYVEFTMLSQPDIRGNVEAMPRGEGDCWIILSDNGYIYYIQHFESVKKQINTEETK